MRNLLINEILKDAVNASFELVAKAVFFCKSLTICHSERNERKRVQSKNL